MMKMNPAKYSKAWAALAGGIVSAILVLYPDLRPFSDELTAAVIAFGGMILVYFAPKNAE